MEVKAYVTNTPVFTKYHDIMEEYLEEYTDKFVKRELKKYSELNPALENEIYSEFFYIAEEFPILLRYSFLVTCYSYEIVGKALFSNISALLYKLDRAQHSDLG